MGGVTELNWGIQFGSVRPAYFGSHSSVDRETKKPCTVDGQTHRVEAFACENHVFKSPHSQLISPTGTPLTGRGLKLKKMRCTVSSTTKNNSLKRILHETYGQRVGSLPIKIIHLQTALKNYQCSPVDKVHGGSRAELFSCGVNCIGWT